MGLITKIPIISTDHVGATTHCWSTVIILHLIPNGIRNDNFWNISSASKPQHMTLWELLLTLNRRHIEVTGASQRHSRVKNLPTRSAVTKKKHELYIQHDNWASTDTKFVCKSFPWKDPFVPWKRTLQGVWKILNQRLSFLHILSNQLCCILSISLQNVWHSIQLSLRKDRFIPALQ